MFNFNSGFRKTGGNIAPEYTDGLYTTGDNRFGDSFEPLGMSSGQDESSITPSGSYTMKGQEGVGLSKQNALSGLMSALGVGGGGGGQQGFFGDMGENSFLTSFGEVTPEIYSNLMSQDGTLSRPIDYYTANRIDQTRIGVAPWQHGSYMKATRDTFDAQMEAMLRVQDQLEGIPEYEKVPTGRDVMGQGRTAGSIDADKQKQRVGYGKQYESLMNQLGVFIDTTGSSKTGAGWAKRNPEHFGTIFNDDGPESVFIKDAETGEFSLNPEYERRASPQSFQPAQGEYAKLIEETPDWFSDDPSSTEARKMALFSASPAGKMMGANQIGGMVGALNPTSSLMRGLSGLAGMITGTDLKDKLSEATDGMSDPLSNALGLSDRPDSFGDYMSLAGTGLKGYNLGKGISKFGLGNVLNSVLSPGSVANAGLGLVMGGATRKTGDFFGHSDSVFNTLTSGLGNAASNMLAPGLGSTGMMGLLAKGVIGDPVSDLLGIRSQDLSRMGVDSDAIVGESFIDSAERIGGGYLKSHYGALSGNPTWSQIAARQAYDRNMIGGIGGENMAQQIYGPNGELFGVDDLGFNLLGTGFQGMSGQESMYNQFAQSMLGPDVSFNAIYGGGFGSDYSGGSNINNSGTYGNVFAGYGGPMSLYGGSGGSGLGGPGSVGGYGGGSSGGGSTGA